MRAAIEGACGATVAEAATAPGGFSLGLAARILCADGRRWFVKAASGQVNSDTPGLHQQVARVLGDLDSLIMSGRLPVPRLRPTVEHGSWFALILDDIDGRHPALPWQDEQVGEVLGALDRLADVLTPAPITARRLRRPLRPRHGRQSLRWSGVPGDTGLMTCHQHPPAGEVLLGFGARAVEEGPHPARGNSFAVLRGAGDTGRMRLFGDGISPEEALMLPLRCPINATGEVVRIGGPLPGPDAGLGRTTPWG